MKYIYLIRSDRLTDSHGIFRTFYGIDVWRLPDRDARLFCSYPALFADRTRAEELAQMLTSQKPSPETLSEIIEAARDREAE